MNHTTTLTAAARATELGAEVELLMQEAEGDINKQLALPSIKARFAELGAEPIPTSTAAFKSTVQAESTRFATVVKARRIKAD